nr:hypothetical protein [Novosphingobium panipatense]
MSAATEHTVAIELAKAQAAGSVPRIAEVLLALVDELRAADVEQDAEMKRLRDIERAAERAWDYHRMGKFDDPDYDDDWDSTIMIERLDALGEVLGV